MLKENLNRNINFVPKGWGYECWLDNSPLYCGKELFIKKDKQLSLHFHKLKTETFFLASGSVRLVVYNDLSLDKKFTNWDEFEKIISMVQNASSLFNIEIFQLVPGDTFFIPVGLRHTLYGNLDSHVYEFSTEHFDSDSYRILKGD